MSYRLIDHTADIGIRVHAPDIAALFHEAAAALIDILDAGGAQQEVSIDINIDGLDLVDTLVRWLQELLYLIQVRGLRVAGFVVHEVYETAVTAVVYGRYTQTPLAMEIKAVTYHGLKIQKCAHGLETTIILDT